MPTLQNTLDTSMKPNFKEMTFGELRKYIIQHQDDEEARHEMLLNRRNPNATVYPASMSAEEMTEVLKRKVKGEL